MVVVSEVQQLSGGSNESHDCPAGRRSRFSSRSWIIVEVEALEFLVVAAGVLSEIKFVERSSSFLAKNILAKKTLVFDFGIWLPRCFGYETEEKEKEKEESEGA